MIIGETESRVTSNKKTSNINAPTLHRHIAKKKKKKAKSRHQRQIKSTTMNMMNN